MILGFVIWSAFAMMFLGISIYCRRAKKPVGFFTGVEPPKVENVTGYNRAVARLWLVFAVLFELQGLPLLWLKQNSVGILPLLLATPVLVIGLAVVYLRIERKYTAK